MFDAITVKKTGQPQAIVVGVLKGKGLGPAAKKLDADGSLAAAAKRAESTGEAGSIAQAFPDGGKPADRVLLLGLGDAKSLTADTIRNAVAAAGRQLSATKATSVRFELDDALTAAKMDEGDAMAAVGALAGIDGLVATLDA